MLEINKKYKIILADPPWKYEFSRSHSRAINDYETLERKEICDFKIKDIADDNSVLLIWITFPKLDWAFDVIESWGFKYRTNAFTWIKKNKKDGSLFWGMGYYTRSNAEICLLATRGKGLKVISHNIHSVVYSPVEEHSKKPDIVRDRIVELFGNLPRIELFARKPKNVLFDNESYKGWDMIGFDIDGVELKESIEKLRKLYRQLELIK